MNFRKLIKKSVYTIAGGALGILAAGLITITALADTTGTVTGDRVNVRSEANTTSTVLAKVEANDTVTITEETTGADGNKWYKIKTSNGTVGYVRADYVKSGTSTSTTTTPTTPSTNDVTTVDNKTAYVSEANNTVNIRKSASTTSDVVATAAAKTELTITGETTGADGQKWYQIKFNGNGNTMTGFIRSDLVTFDAPKTDTQPAETTVEGGTGEGEGGEEGTETGEGGGTETTSETGTETSSSTATTAQLQFLEPVGEPANLPADFEPVEVMMGEQIYSAWAKGDYYIIYGISGNSDAQWYVYDYKNNSFVSYDGLFSADETAKKSSFNPMILVIILGALAVIFLITTIFFAFRAFSGKDDGYEGDYDFGYDDDEEEPDDYEELDEEDDDYYDQKPAKTKHVIFPKKAEKAKKEEDYDDEEEDYDDEEDEDDYYDDDEDDEEYVKPSKKKGKKEKKSFKNKILDYFTTTDDDDEDDEDYDDEDEYDEDEDYDDDSTSDSGFIDL
ncbi:MAG: SH3 domain-containing protein [Lachnospiraceae bacterium]|jgi:Nucleic-acid-binding protein possibly involved in ribosomal biogenesis|nr:SH3 domain-containing protein [Lachnospiraceae bacterium]